MFGDNPIRKPESGSGDVLFVQSIFPTFQGEGPFVGYPSVFIRLGGCNLACKFCDTEFENFKQMRLDEILKEVHYLAEDKRKLVVITGGEPMRQPIELLCVTLLENGFNVQIETNGTLFRNLAEEVSIVCSPKNTGIGYQRIREDLLPKITAIKFIISENKRDYNDIAEVGQSDYDIPVYVQPMDEYDVTQNNKNLQKALAVAQENGYRISLQMHKTLNIE